MPINYIIGDAAKPVLADKETGVLVHCCNDIGTWGAGFVLALSKRWSAPEAAYRAWSKGGGQGEVPFKLGQVPFVLVEQNLWVANLIGQHGVGKQSGIPPIRYEAIREGLKQVATFATEHNAGIHMPRLGSGLAGGDWQIISQIISEELVNRHIRVTVYDLARVIGYNYSRV